MTKRKIRSHGGSNNLIDALSSIFLLEAVEPSNEIFIFSPWISDTAIIENITNKHFSIFPFVDQETIYLSDFIELCSWRGANIKIICRMRGSQTLEFYNNMKSFADFGLSQKEHDKAFITNNFCIYGSMNFTKSGINFNGESVTVSSNKSDISQAFITAKEVWSETKVI